MRETQQPREHAVFCRGSHDMRKRPETWRVDGYCCDECRDRTQELRAS